RPGGGGRVAAARVPAAAAGAGAPGGEGLPGRRLRAAGPAVGGAGAAGRAGDYDRSAPFDPDVMGDAAVMNLGICRLRLGQLERAEACFRRLLDNPGQYAKALQNLAAVEDLRWRSAKKKDEG